VDVTFDATGLSAGTYNGDLCIESNDPDEPVVYVPVELTVEEVQAQPIISVDPTSLYSEQYPDEQVVAPLDISNLGDADLLWDLFEELLGSDAMLDLSEGFDDISLLPGMDWYMINHSEPLGSTEWFQGNDTVFPAHQGATTSYIGANYNNTSGTGTISNWLLSPELNLSDGSALSFWTRTVEGSIYPDRLQVRMSTAGGSTNVGTGAFDVGDFTELLLDINPTYEVGGYPESWTEYVLNITGTSPGTTGRLAFRYFVEGGGPSGANSNYIGIDTFYYTEAAVEVCNPGDITWLSESPTSGTTAPAGTDTVDVTFDSTGLVAGTYAGTLCVESNDPVNPVVRVPVTMDVIEAPLVPAIALTKTVGLNPNVCSTDDSLEIPAGYGGTDVTYCYAVENTGPVTVTVHDLVDSELGTILDDFPYDLAPGASTFLTQTVLITQTTVNTATWTAYDDSGVPASATDSASVVMANPTGVTLSGFESASPVALLPVTLAALLAVLMAGFMLVRKARKAA
jgi:hypothetical protein